MSLTKSTPNTFVLNRSFSATPERVFAAFSDPAKKRRWFADSDSHDVQTFDMDFRVGGAQKARFLYKQGTPIAGMTIVNDSIYMDIVPNNRIILASTMSLGENPISVTLVTVEIVPTEKGTDLILTHQGVFFEGSGGPAMREQGWKVLMDRLATELAR